MSSLTKSSNDPRELYLGLLYPTEDYKVYPFKLCHMYMVQICCRNVEKGNFFHYSHVGNIYSKNKLCYFETRIFHRLGPKVFLLPGHKFPFWNMFPNLATMLLLQFCFSLAMLLIFIYLIVFVTEFDHFVVFVCRSLHEVFKKVC